MKVDQQSDWNIQQLHVTEKLRLARRMQSVDSLQLDEQTVVNEEVKPQRFVKNKTFVFYSNDFLRGGRNRTQFELPQQASLVN